jgi:GNAT superfamily N-acetyltransferase
MSDERRSTTPEYPIRDFRPEDMPGVAEVIRSVYREYNYVMDFDEFDRDIADIPATYQDVGGAFWVMADGTDVIGTVAVLPRENDTCELKRLYLRKRYRRAGLGTRLLKTMIGWAITHGFRRIVLWSDTLFDPAHRMYVKFGFTPTDKLRSIDPMNPTCVERYFVKEDL